MTYKRFYFGRVDAQILKDIDAEHKTKMKQLIKEINQGTWTEKQKKKAKKQHHFKYSLVSVFHR